MFECANCGHKFTADRGKCPHCDSTDYHAIEVEEVVTEPVVTEPVVTEPVVTEPVIPITEPVLPDEEE